MPILRKAALEIASDLPKGDPTRRKLLAALEEKQAGRREEFQIANTEMEWELLGPDDKTVQEHSSYEGEFHSLRDMLKGLNEVPAGRILHDPKNWTSQDEGHIKAEFSADSSGFEDDDGDHWMIVNVRFQFARVYNPTIKELAKHGIR